MEDDSDESTREEESTFAEGVLHEEEKAEIRSMSLPVHLAKEIPAVDTSDEENPEDESDGDSVSSSSSNLKLAPVLYATPKWPIGIIRRFYGKAFFR